MKEVVKGRVSLLLTTYNSRDVLQTTLDSIEMQDYGDVEICVADSCSTDGTLAILEEYSRKSKYSVVYASKKDGGVYEGFNNAIALSSGEYLQVMNDRFTTIDAISKLVNAIADADTLAGSEHQQVIGVHSDLVYAENGHVVRYWHMGQGDIRAGWMPAHPTLMLKRQAYDVYGLYDESYEIAGDYEFMVRVLKNGQKLAYVSEVLVSMYYGGTSNASLGSYIKSAKEAIRALKANQVKPALLITCFRTVRVALQFFS